MNLLRIKVDEKNNMLFENLNVEIYKGDKIGIKGQTGTGKSTFIDLMIGIIKPDEGQIFLDNNELHKQVQKTDLLNSVAHIPQEIYLIDSFSRKNNLSIGGTINKVNTAERLRPPRITDPKPL